MGNVYGAPFDREAQLERWLRRARPGLVAGRSEAAGSVVFRRRLRVDPGKVGVPGTGGAPGKPVGGNPLIDNHHMWGLQGFSGPAGFNTFQVQTSGVLTGWPGLASGGDLASVPYFVVTDDPAVSTNVAAAFLNLPLCQMGQGNGRGGFLCVVQFGFRTAIPAGKKWFAGVGTNVPAGAVNSFVGVGALTAGAAPSFVHSGTGVGSATSVATGTADIAIDTVYEVRVFADPRRTDALIRFERFLHGRSVQVVDHVASTNLPVDAMQPVVAMWTSPAAGSCHIAVRYLYLSDQPIGETIDS